MKDEEGHRGPGARLFSFFLGAIVGVGIALLVAPKSGKETREQIKKVAEEAKEKAEGFVDELKEVNRWVSLVASLKGTRDENEDFVAFRTFPYWIHHTLALIACDGVGSRPEGAACATAVGKAALSTVRQYLLRRWSLRSLDREDASRLAESLQNITLHDVSKDSATTMVLCLFYRSLLRKEWHVIAFWVGDSRLYLLDSAGELRQLTHDHHDNEGRVLAFFGGDGKVSGAVATAYHILPDAPSAICVTTDGVHDHCSSNELRHFLLYCISQGLENSDVLSSDLSEFLKLNVSDNFSLGLHYRSLAYQEIALIGADLSEEETCKS